MTFGEKLYKLRKSKHLTQFQLADSLDLSQNAISQSEKGVRQTSMKVIKSIAKYFNVAVAALMPSEGIADNEFVQQVAESICERPKLAKIFDKAISMSDSDLDAVLAVVNAIAKDIDPE